MKIRIVLIIGSTHGIGKAIVVAFCQKGVIVYGCSSTPDDPNILLLEEYPNYHHTTVDVSKEEQVKEWVTACGQFDAVINCAGIGCVPRDLDQMRTEDAHQVLEVNLMGSAYTMKYALPVLRRCGGIIVNLGSIAATTPGTGADWSYCASKAALAAMTREVANRESSGSIYFVLLTLGYIETRMTAADDKSLWINKTPFNKIGRPEEVAEMVSRILEHPRYGEFAEYKMIGGGYFGTQ